MRLGEYLLWGIATITTLLFVTAVVPKRWSDRTKVVFRIAVAAAFFFLIGIYWLATGEKFDETAYRIVLCRIYYFERCSSVSRTERSGTETSPQKDETQPHTQENAHRKREESGDIALANARQYWGRRNLKVAAEFSEQAIKIWSSLPDANESRIKDKIAAAHSIVGLGLALLGATPKDQAYGCGRLDTARRLYHETGNRPMISHVEQNIQLGNCLKRH